MMPNTIEQEAISQISPSMAGPGATSRMMPIRIESAPDSPISHSLSISLRRRIAPMIWKMPSAMAQHAMKIEQHQRRHARHEEGHEPAAMPAMPTSASHQREPTLPPMIACANASTPSTSANAP